MAVSDRNVTLYNPEGLAIPALIEYTARNHGDLPATDAALASIDVKAQILGREEILYLNTDVLFLAALEEQIRKDNVEKVKARIIVEGANAPVTGEADELLTARGTIIIPDILANAGGVIVSYFEWLQGRETQFYSEDEVFTMLYAKMQKTLNGILPAYFKEPFTLRQSCYNHAVIKLSTMLYRQGKLY
ncbi:Glutamate dehydrogenase [compost metagenome]